MLLENLSVQRRYGIFNYNKYKELAELEISSIINRLDADNNLIELLKYVTADGKRIRPVLGLALSESFGSKENFASSAVAIDFLHVSSLIHDDLPAIDNDDYRRGKLACHKKFTESEAILGANYLTAVAFKIADPRFVSYLSDAFMALNWGQILDLDENERVNDLERIHRLKTGALFSTCFSLAGIAGNFEKELLEKLRILGVNFGILFQYYNDFIDQHEDAKVTGRIESSDQKNNRVGVFTEDREESKLILDRKITGFKEDLVRFQDENNLKLDLLFEILELLGKKIK